VRLSHSLLRIGVRRRDVRELCESLTEGVLAVPPLWVADARETLGERSVVVAAGVGWPWGFSPASAKAVESATAAADGAGELWLMVNLGALESGLDFHVLDDLQSVQDVAGPAGTSVHVAIPDGLAPRDRGRLVQMAAECEADGLILGSDFTEDVLSALNDLTDLPLTRL
jgi:deoxyribose-phosphate aldolase